MRVRQLVMPTLLPLFLGRLHANAHVYTRVGAPTQKTFTKDVLASVVIHR